MLAGITKIALITNPEHISVYKKLLGNGKSLGLTIDYVIQDNPTGIPDSLSLVPNDYKNDCVMLVLGDNFIYGMGLGGSLKSMYNGNGAMVFGYQVNNPQDYGVVSFDENGKVLDIEEKPKYPKSNFAIPGIYFLDNNCYEFVTRLKPSDRGETEITDLLKCYMQNGNLRVKTLARGTAWLDTGTFDNLLAASEFVKTIEIRQGLKIGCIEEIALREGLISKEQFGLLIQQIPECEYSNYLKNLSIK